MAAPYSPTDVFLGQLPEGKRENNLKDLQDYLSVERIELNDTVQSGTAHFLGKSPMLNIDCQVESVVGPDAAYILLCARPLGSNGNGWNFGQAFPDMPGDWLSESERKLSGSFFLRFLTLNNPLWLYVGLSNGTPKATLVNEIKKLKLFQDWTQEGKEKLLQELDLVQSSGMYMWGNIPDPPPAIQDLLNFLEGSTGSIFRSALLKGRVEIPSTPIYHTVEGEQQVLYAVGYPLLSMGISLGERNFGSDQVTLDAGLELISPLYFSTSKSSIRLSGALSLPNLSQSVAAQVDFPVEGDTIAVTGTYTAGLPFIDGTTLPGVEEGNAGQATLGTSVLLEFSKSTKRLTKMAFGASMKNLVFLDGKLSIGNLGLFFQIFDPLGTKVISGSLEATAFLGKSRAFELSLGGTYPDGRMYLQMQSQSLRKVVSELGVTDNTELIPDLSIRLMSIEYNYQLQFFASKLIVDGSWGVVDWLVLEELRFGITGSPGSLDLAASAQFQLAGTRMRIAAGLSAQGQQKNWLFSAGMVEGESIALGKLLEDLAQKFGPVHLPPVLSGLSINKLEFSFNSATNHFFFTMGLLFPINDKTELDLSLTIEIEKQGLTYVKRFGGTALIADLIFDLAINKSSTESSFLATYNNPLGLGLNPLVLIEKLNPEENFISKEDREKLGVFTIHNLGFLYESKTLPALVKTYTFTGSADWAINLPFGENDSSFKIVAEVKFIKIATVPGLQKGSFIRGSLESSDIEFLKTLRLGVVYYFDVTAPRLVFEAVIGPFLLELEHKTDPVSGDKIIIIAPGSADKANELTFGGIITYMVSLVDPNEVDFQLDPPWDALNKIKLSGFLFEINITQKSVSVIYKTKIDLGFITINSIGLTYDQTPPPTRPSSSKVLLELDVRFGNEDKPLKWDPVNDAPPAIPGQGSSVFELRYLGLGQHIAFTGVTQVKNIKEVMGLLRGVLDKGTSNLQHNRQLRKRPPLELFGPSGGPIAFSAESEWLIGLDITLLKALNLSIIFNDPLIYGLRLELYGETAKNFAGLQFEILYRRISDNVGVYHIELILPDFVRYLQFGSVSITLPELVLDIFTNGDFKVDLGFPWNFNFARSFAIEVFPFVGGGGFYFNKLSAATATSTPVIPEHVGVFTPVYEFGLGLKIGLGKSFRAGPLRAEVSITVQGIIEGVISWYNSRITEQRTLYYAIKGGVSIVGRLVGAVDFKIIKIEIEVIARATIKFVVIVYEPILVILEASVSVKASVTIVFVKISFSFSLKIKFSFTIGQGEEPVWVKEARENPLVTSRGMSRSIAFARSRSVLSRSLPVPILLNWQGIQLPEAVPNTKKDLDLFFQPGLSWTESGIVGEALFFLENSLDGASDTKDFDTLSEDLFRWTFTAAGFREDANMVSFEDMDRLFDAFTDPQQKQFSFEELQQFLADHFTFRVQTAPQSRQGTIFPPLPQLTLQIGQSAAVSFEQAGTNLSPTELEELKAYFDEIKVKFDAGASGPVDIDSTAGASSINQFLLTDYARLLIRSRIQIARDYLEELKKKKVEHKLLSDLLTELETEKSGDIRQIAAMASRYLLHGIRLPELGANGTTRPEAALYKAMGQQFSFDDAKINDGAAYQIIIGKTDSSIAISFPENQPQLIFNMPADIDRMDEYPLLDHLEQLKGLSVSKLAVPNPQLSPMPFYKDEKLSFGIRKWSEWKQADGSTQHLLPFSTSLETYLLEKAVNPTFSLFKEALEDDAKLSAYSWATRIELPIRLIPDPETGTFLRDVYTLGSAGEAGKDRLEQAWTNLNEKDELFLLYNPNGSDGKLENLPGNTGDILLIKRNLSTEHYISATGNIPPTPVYAANPDNAANIKKFIQLTWEASTISSGGFFLQVPHSTDSVPGHADGTTLNQLLFGTDNEATLIIVIKSDSRAIQDYHNCVIVADAGLDPENDLILAQSEESVPVLSVPAGYVGFELTRPEATVEYPEITLKKNTVLRNGPSASAGKLADLAQGKKIRAMGKSKDKKWLCVFSSTNRNQNGWIEIKTDVLGDKLPTLLRKEAANLYQLLAYQVEEHSSFRSSKFGMPIGPTSNGVATNWLYERMVPYFALVKTLPTNSAIGSLPTAADPYLGIAPGAEMKIDAWWQDLYGNRLSTPQKTVFKVGYTDPIIGINQWPSVMESYEIEPKSADTVTIKIELSFDPSSYGEEFHGQNTESRQKALDAARQVYRNVHYQLLQSDISIKLTCSLISDWNAEMDLAKLRSFVRNVYLLLEGIDNDPAPARPAPYRQSFDISIKDNNGLLFPRQFIFGLNASIFIQRSPDRIHPLLMDANNNRIRVEHQEVLEAKAVLSPKVGDAKAAAPIFVPNPPVSLNQLASGRAQLKAIDLVQANSNALGLMKAGKMIRLQENGPEIAVEADDSFASLILRYQKMLREEGVTEIPDISLADLTAVVADEEDLLVSEARLSVASLSLRQFAAKFQEAVPGLRLAVSKERKRRDPASKAADTEFQPVWAVQLGKQGIQYDLKEQFPAFFALTPLSTSLFSEKILIDDYKSWKNDVEVRNSDPEFSNPPAEEKQFEAIDLNVLARDFLVAIENFLEPEFMIPAYESFPQLVESVIASKDSLANTISNKQLQVILTKDKNIGQARLKEAQDAILEQLLTHLVEGYDVETVVQYEADVEVGDHLKDTLNWTAGHEPRLAGKAKIIDIESGDTDLKLSDVDFSISTGKIDLKPATGKTYFTYLFDTRTPEKFSSLRLELNFDTAEIEYDIESVAVPENRSYQASSWLSFILPADLKAYRLTDDIVQRLEKEHQVTVKNANKLEEIKNKAFDSAAAYLADAKKALKGQNADQLEKALLLVGQLHKDNPGYMGRTNVPIPLRNYPMPPSLIRHQAVADPDSLEELARIREWSYTMIYEHLDIAQDSIDCVIQLNAPPTGGQIAAGNGTANTGKRGDLFKALVNFSQCYPILSQDLGGLKEAANQGSEAIQLGLTAFSTLVKEVAAEWTKWSPLSTVFTPAKGDLHYLISEDPDESAKKGFIEPIQPSIFKDLKNNPNPILDLPGFDRKEPVEGTINDTGEKEFVYIKDETETLFFGDSSIPDRMLSIMNLDIIHHQNAWGTVWLSRNKVLIKDGGVADENKITNPVFIFQTPTVRFNNVLSPYLVNSERWDIAKDLKVRGNPAGKRTLEKHLQALFDTLLPKKTDQNYDLRLSCRFGFPLAKGRGLHHDMISTLPILLGQRLNKTADKAAYQQELAAEIKEWLRAEDPPREGSMLIFSVNLFSKLDAEALSNLPMLRIEHLGLKLEDVEDV